MDVVLIVLGAWLVLDVVLLAIWLSLSSRGERTRVRTMLRAAERHANAAPPGRRSSRGELSAR